MYVQIVTYNLNGVSEQDYIDIAHQVSGQFAAMGGLEAKVWLRHPDATSFAAVYFWEDRESQERFAASDLFEATYPGFANVVSESYEVYEHLTRATQPVLDILEEEEAGWAPPPVPPVEPIAESGLVDEPPELVEEEEELVDELEDDELEEELDEEELEPVEAAVMEEPEPVVRVTRSRLVKKAPKKAPARKAAVTKVVGGRKSPGTRATKSTKVAKVTKKAPPVPKAAASKAARATKVTKVIKKVGKRPVKAGSQRAKKLR